MYLSSSIKQQPSGLYKAAIITSWFYFGQQVEHETFKTIGECRDWLITKRCENLSETMINTNTMDNVIVPNAPPISYADKLKGNSFIC